MEAVTIAGLAVVAVGGYYSVLDLIADLGIRFKKRKPAVNRDFSSCSYILAQQARIKKVAGMNI